MKRGPSYISLMDEFYAVFLGFWTVEIMFDVSLLGRVRLIILSTIVLLVLLLLLASLSSSPNERRFMYLAPIILSFIIVVFYMSAVNEPLDFVTIVSLSLMTVLYTLSKELFVYWEARFGLSRKFENQHDR